MKALKPNNLDAIDGRTAIAERPKPVKALKRKDSGTQLNYSAPDSRETKACEGTETASLDGHFHNFHRIAERPKPVKALKPRNRGRGSL